VCVFNFCLFIQQINVSINNVLYHRVMNVKSLLFKRVLNFKNDEVVIKQIKSSNKTKVKRISPRLII
jgi:hypothetical protein